MRALVPLPLALSLLLLGACDRGLLAQQGEDGLAAVTDLAVTDPRDGERLALTWTNPKAEGFRGVRVLRRSDEPVFSPTDALATVIYEGTREDAEDTGTGEPLVVGTTYHYAVYAVYGEDEFSSPASASEALSFFGPPSTFAATATSEGVALSWALPDPRGDIAAVRVRRTTGAQPGSEGAADETVVFEGDGAAFVDDGVATGTRYYYGVVCVDGDGVVSEELFADEQTTPGAVRDLVVTARPDGAIDLSWTNPADPSFDAAVVVRTVGAPAGSPDGGLVVCEEAGASSCVDRFPVLGQANHYTVFARDLEGRAASGVSGSATPLDPVSLGYVVETGAPGGAYDYDDIYRVRSVGGGDYIAVGAISAPSDGSAGGPVVGGTSGSETVGVDASTGDALIARYSSAGALEWARTVGAPTSTSRSWASDAAALDDGSLVVVGTYRSHAVFAGGGTTLEIDLLHSALSCMNAGHACGDGFVARYSADGTPLWVMPLGVVPDASEDGPTGVARAPGGGAYVVGVFDGDDGPTTLQVGRGASAVTATVDSGGYQYNALYVLRMSQTGGVEWLKAFVGTGFSSVDDAAVAVAPDGDAVVTGVFRGDLVLGEGASAVTLQHGGDGSRDAFVARFSPAGGIEWALHLEGHGRSRAPDVAVAADGTIVVAGSHDTELRAGGVSLPAPIEDPNAFRSPSAAYLLRLDESGAVVGAFHTDEGRTLPRSVGAAVALADDGSVLFSGMFIGEISLGGAVLGGESEGASFDDGGNAFIARFSPTGEPLWARTVGGTAVVGVGGAAYLGGGRFVVGGTFSGDAVFLPESAGEVSVTAADDEGFVCAVDDEALAQ